METTMNLQKMMLACIICIMVLARAGTDSSLFAADGSQLEGIIHRIEKQYRTSGLSARFEQRSTIKAMQITDTASGRLYIKPPGKMRWEYEKPETQIIMSDGIKLWVYRPDDRQVMVGPASRFFGNGKGVGFLSDIGDLKNMFDISLEKSRLNGFYRIKLIPRKKTIDLTHIILRVSKDIHDIVEIFTYISLGDETRIKFLEPEFDRNLDDGLFNFIVPEGSDVVRMDE